MGRGAAKIMSKPRSGFRHFKFVLRGWECSFLMARAGLPHMLKRITGRIVHVASVPAKEGNAGMLAYSAPKAAVMGMTKVQGKEYAETGITVNAFAPAVIRTAMVDALPEAQVSYMTDKIPMKRCGTLDECAHMIRAEALDATRELSNRRVPAFTMRIGMPRTLRDRDLGAESQAVAPPSREPWPASARLRRWRTPPRRPPNPVPSTTAP